MKHVRDIHTLYAMLDEVGGLGLKAGSGNGALDVTNLYKSFTAEGFAKSRERFDLAYTKVEAQELRRQEEDLRKEALSKAALSIQGAYRYHLRCAPASPPAASGQ